METLPRSALLLGGAAGRVDVGPSSLLHMTSFKLTSGRASSVPQPVGYACLSFVLIFYVSITVCELVPHTSVISTSSVLSLFSCCRRGCCLGGGGAARTCSNEKKQSIGSNLRAIKQTIVKNRDDLLFFV